METVTINGKTVKANRLGNGVSTTAYSVTDNRYNNGVKVLLFTSCYDIVKEGISKRLQSTNKLNVHIPRIRRIGVGYDDSNNFCLVYESPFYNVFADSNVYESDNSQRAYSVYNDVSSELTYSYGGIRSTLDSVKRANIPTGIKNAMVDILNFAIGVELPESHFYGLDMHSGNGAYDSKGRLILLDIFHNGGITAKSYIECYESDKEVYIESGRISDYDRITESESESAYRSPSYCNCRDCRRARGYIPSTCRIFAPITYRIHACRTAKISHGNWHFARFTTQIRAKRTFRIVAPNTPLVVTRKYDIMVWPKWVELENNGKWGYCLTDSDYALLAENGYRRMLDSCAVMVTVYARNYDSALSQALHNGNALLGSDKLEF